MKQTAGSLPQTPGSFERGRAGQGWASLLRACLLPFAAVVAALGLLSCSGSGGQGEAFVEDEAVAGQMLRLADEMVAEIHLLRTNVNVGGIPMEAELLDGRGPPHLYVKGQELQAKLRRVHRQFGLDAPNAQSPPVGPAITDESALRQMEELLRSLRATKALMAVDGSISPVPLASSKTYSMVYKRLADASFLLDDLAGQALTPRDVVRNLSQASELISMIAAQLGAEAALDIPSVEGGKSATDVERQLVLAIEKAVALQSQLGLTASKVPSLPMVRVSPSENHDAANMLIAELLRIASHLNVTGFNDGQRPLPQQASLTDAYALTLLANTNLEALAGAVQ